MSIKIGLDAGHGGSSSGTYSCNSTKDGLFEEHYALELVKLVNERLKANGFETFLTRSEDMNPGNVSERAKMCLKAGCNYAVSIHFNGFENTSANGCEVFVPYAERGAGIEAGYYNYLGKFFKPRAPFARCNNTVNRNETFDKRLNLKTRKFDSWSTEKKEYFGFIRTAWEGGLSADLLEVCFLTNPEDFKTYTENREKIADAIARSICEGYKVKWETGEATEKPSEENGNYFIVFKDKNKAEAFAESVGAFVTEA